jgi:cell division septum initiation protein DivIVA
MTPEDPFARRPAQSPRAIKAQATTFTIRRRGLDPAEVTAFLVVLAEQIEYSDADRAELRAELERVRSRTPDQDERAHITAHAVGLLSQAQQIADNLVAEAEQYAKDLVETARHQQRDVLRQARDSVESAAQHLPHGGTHTIAGPHPATVDLEYVRTFTQVAHIQLRSVLDALAEQVERLGQLPQSAAPPAEIQPPPATAGDVQWWIDLSNTPVPPD